MTREKLDKRKKVKESDIVVGDKVLLAQKKGTTVPPFDPKPYTVTSSRHNIIVAERGRKKLRRHAGMVKKLYKRPAHLIKEKHNTKYEHKDSTDEDDDGFDIELIETEDEAEIQASQDDDDDVGGAEDDRDHHQDEDDVGGEEDDRNHHQDDDDEAADDQQNDHDDDHHEEEKEAEPGPRRSPRLLERERRIPLRYKQYVLVTQDDCGVCSNCRDMIKFGGPGTLGRAFSIKYR